MAIDTQAASAAAPGQSARSGLLASRPWAAVVLLMLLGVLNYLDRFLPAILAEPLKRDLGLSDTFLGVLNGIGFLAVYAVAGIPIARVADRGRYGAVISAAVAVWSVMTGLGGLVTAGWQLALTRVGVAVGEAGSTPAAHAYISRNFPPERRATALAVLTLGVPLGAMAGLIGGGLIGELLGWRRTFLVMGAAGLVVAPIVLLALGARQPVPARSAVEAGALAGQLRKSSVLAIFVATAFISMGGYSVTAFSPAFLIRVHGMSVGDTGFQFGLLTGAVGTVALLSTGWLAGRLAKRDPRWMLGMLTLMILICLPFGVAAYLVADRVTAMVCMAINYAASASYLALTVASLHSLVPIAMRARASAVLLFCSALFGGLGPLFTGMISDALHAAYGPAALGRALLIVPVTYGLSALGFAAAITTFRRDMVQEPAGAAGAA